MADPSLNGHELKKRVFPPFAARLRHEELFRSADGAEWARGGRPDGQRAGPIALLGRLGAGRRQPQADRLRHPGPSLRYVALDRVSGIETRPAPPQNNGPQLGVAGVLVSRPSDGLIGETDTVPAALD